MCISWFCILFNKCISACSECECSKECCKRIPVKRYFLPFIGVLAMAFFERFRDFIYFPFIISGAFFILFGIFQF